MSRAQASPELCAFVHEQAPPHYVSADAPDTWLRLNQWYSNALTREVMPAYRVYGGGCDRTIYPDVETNHAFRAWHDSIHCLNGYSFNLADEIRVGLIHMQQARRAGLPRRDLDMLIADTIGQIQYYTERKVYVDDQARFVADVLDFGLRAVLDTGRIY